MICKVECKEEKNALQCDHNALHGKKQLQKYSPESIFYCSTLFGRRLKDQAAEMQQSGWPDIVVPIPTVQLDRLTSPQVKTCSF